QRDAEPALARGLQRLAARQPGGRGEQRGNVDPDLQPGLVGDANGAVREGGIGACCEQRCCQDRAAARLRRGRLHGRAMLAGTENRKRTGTLIAVLLALLAAPSTAATGPTATTGVPPGSTPPAPQSSGQAPQPAASSKPAPAIADNAVLAASK